MMRTIHRMLSVSALAAQIIMVCAQSEIRLNTDAKRTFQGINASCVLEFFRTNDDHTYVAFGGNQGTVFYRYVPGDSQTIQRIGHLSPTFGGRADELATGPFGTVAIRVSDRVYLWSLDDNLRLRPHGMITIPGGVSRVQSLPESESQSAFLIVGTNSGRLQVYRLEDDDGTLPESRPWNSALTIGSPIVDLPLFSSAVRALAAWEHNNTQYIAVGGSDGMVYLYQLHRYRGTVTLIGKAMYHPAPVAQVVAASGRYLIASLSNGLVYVWTYTEDSVEHHLTIKGSIYPLGAASVCVLPDDRVAVSTDSVRVYSLRDGSQVGEYGVSTYVPNPTFQDFVNDRYWLDPRMDYVYRRFPYSYQVLAPYVRENSFFYMATNNAGAQTAFLPSSSALSYEERTYQSPVYAMTYLNGQVVEGLANGTVRLPNNTTLQLDGPVFDLTTTPDGWVIGAYGVGKVFAWKNGRTINNILPPQDYIVYCLELLVIDENDIQFLTVGGNGRVTLWQWQPHSGSPATSQRDRSIGRPCHQLTVNADRTRVAVASATSWPSTWVLPLPNLDSSRELFEARVIAFHPTRSDEIAWSIGRPWHTDVVVISNLREGSIHALVETGNRVTNLQWLDGDRLVATVGRGHVYVLSRRGATNNRLRRDGQTNNPHYGNPIDATRALYRPTVSRPLALCVRPDGGQIAVGDSAGRSVSFSNAGQPVAEMLYLPAGLQQYFAAGSIDYLPDDGVVLPHMVIYPHSSTPRRYALYPAFCRYALWIPGTSSAAFTGGSMVQEITSDGDVRPSLPYGYIYGWFPEIAESGQRAVVFSARGRTSSRLTLQALFFNRIEEFPYFQPLQTQPLTLGEYGANQFIDLSINESGQRYAITQGSTIEVRSVDSGSTQANLSVDGQVYRVKFLGDETLAVIRRINNALHLDIWQQRSDSFWERVTTSSVSLPVTDQISIDAVRSERYDSGWRIVVASANGLAFYRYDLGSDLTEVGRVSGASNGYLDVPYITWARFSRHEPDILGVASLYEPTAITYDLSASGMDW